MDGLQLSNDAQLHAELLWRRTGQLDQLVVATDSTVMAGSDAGIPGNIDTTLMAAAVPAQCDDLLVLRVQMTAGTSGYIEFSTSVTVP